MVSALLPLALVVTALACAYIAIHIAIDWVLGRNGAATNRLPMCDCDTVPIDDGLLSVTFSGTTHTRSVCHPEAS